VVAEFEGQAKLLGGTVITIAQKVGENDHLFGSVTAQNIADQLEKKHFTVDRRKIQLEEPIKTLGEHKISIKLHREVTAEITVNVIKEED
jgi:large subunit ribosomal protein L9